MQKNTPPVFGDDFMRSGIRDGLGAQWKVVSGTFAVAGEAQAERAASPFHAVAKPGDGEAAARAGRWYWNDYLVAASFEYSGGVIGLDAYVHSSGFLRFSAGNGRVVLSLVDAATGKLRELAAKDVQLVPGWHQLALAVKKGRATAFLDLSAMLEAEALPPCGTAGVYASGNSVRIDDVVVLPLDGAVPLDALKAWWGAPPVVRPLFERDPAMQGWSRSSSIFRYDRRTNTVASIMPLPAPYSVSFTLPRVDGQLDVSAGEVFHIRRAGGSISLNEGESAEAKGECVLEVGDKSLKFSVAGRELLARQRSDAAAGGPVPVVFSGQLASSLLSSLSISGTDVRQFTFYRAPALFQPLSGNWAESSLWACSPQYSWLQGRSGFTEASRVAALRYRELLNGDFHIRAVVAVPMAGDQTPYYEFPTNFGVMLSHPSGEAAPVTCIYGLCDMVSVIADGPKIAASGSYRTSPFVRRKFSLVKEYVHTTWFDVELTRKGGLVTMKRDGRSLASARLAGLPPVLEASFLVADNGVAISRLEVAAEKLSAQAYRSPTLSESARRLYIDLVYRDFPDRAETQRLLAERAAVNMLAPAARTLPVSAAADKAFREAAGRRYFKWTWDEAHLPAGFSGFDGVELFPREDGSLLVVNRHQGGGMLLPLAREPFDLRDYP
ncbi:MAG TPA: hypothetical protein ENN09_03030, partial [Planctomycetes bacterium]|nr:hypothetical protein [Planctomycetota bacterium]